MATTTTFYNSYKKNCLDGTIDLENDTIKVALVTSSYTPDIDSHAFFDDITNEVSASGTYVAGGIALGTKTTTQDNTDNEGVFDSADYSLTGATITARYAIIYKDTGSAATSPLIAYIDFGEDKSSSAGTFGITWNAEGIINVN
jgi:hypothetical protein